MFDNDSSNVLQMVQNTPYTVNNFAINTTRNIMSAFEIFLNPCKRGFFDLQEIFGC